MPLRKYPLPINAYFSASFAVVLDMRSNVTSPFELSLPSLHQGRLLEQAQQGLRTRLHVYEPKASFAMLIYDIFSVAHSLLIHSLTLNSSFSVLLLIFRERTSHFQNEAINYTAPRYGLYLTHAHNCIPRALPSHGLLSRYGPN